MIWLIRQLLYLRKAFTARDAPRHVALGFALGMMLGLVPKGNLLAVGLSMVLFASRANIGVAMLSALAFSLLGSLADPLTGRVGLALLSWDVLRPMWTSLYNLPLVPWTAFNNTVVLGSFLLGLLLCYPAYRLAWRFCEWRRSKRVAHEANQQEEPEVKEAPLLAGSSPAT